LKIRHGAIVDNVVTYVCAKFGNDRFKYKKLSYCWETVRRESMPKDCWNGRENDNLGWNDLQMYFKVIKSGTNRNLLYDFLLVVYSNFCRMVPIESAYSISY